MDQRVDQQQGQCADCRKDPAAHSFAFGGHGADFGDWERLMHHRAPRPAMVYSCSLASQPTQGELMAKPNYSHQKKLREQAAKKKREEKLERKQQKKEEAPPPA